MFVQYIVCICWLVYCGCGCFFGVLRGADFHYLFYPLQFLISSWFLSKFNLKKAFKHVKVYFSFNLIRILKFLLISKKTVQSQTT